MTSAKCIEYCRGLDKNFTLAVLKSAKCMCGTSHTLDLTEEYVLSKSQCQKKVDTSGLEWWNEHSMVGENNSSPQSVALYNIDYETNRYHGDKYGASTCFDATRELMLTRYEIFSFIIFAFPIRIKKSIFDKRRY